MIHARGREAMPEEGLEPPTRGYDDGQEGSSEGD
jgi:hypothetical protein